MATSLKIDDALKGCVQHLASQRRCFLGIYAPDAARRAGQAIELQFLPLETAPDIGHPFPDVSELRELVIAFGVSGYIALYRHEPAADAVYVLAFQPQKEADY